MKHGDKVIVTHPDDELFAQTGEAIQLLKNGNVVIRFGNEEFIYERSDLAVVNTDGARTTYHYKRDEKTEIINEINKLNNKIMFCNHVLNENDEKIAELIEDSREVEAKKKEYLSKKSDLYQRLEELN